MSRKPKKPLTPTPAATPATPPAPIQQPVNTGLAIVTMILKIIVGFAILAGAFGGWHYFKADGFLMFLLGMVGVSIIANAFGLSLE